MMHESSPGGSVGGSLMLFLAGAAVGGLLVALNTPKTGSELREDLKGLGRRAQKGAEGLADDTREAWDKLKRRTREAREDVRQDLTED